MPTLAVGGAERHGVLLATALQCSHWEPHVLSFGDGPLRDDLEAVGIPLQIHPVSATARAVPAGAQAVRRAIGRVRPDVVSGHNVVVELSIRLAMMSRRLPSISWKHTYGHVGHRGVRERWIEQLTGAHVTCYGAVCHTQVRYLTDALHLPGEKIAVVRNAVPVPTSLPAPPPPGSPVVSMVATMRADKDHSTVLRAWPAVLAAHPGAELHLVGDGACRPDLETLAHRLGIASSVHFLGAAADGGAVLKASSLLVLASYNVECFPYAALEAMAAARGVVSTNVGGLPEMIEDGVTGRLVPPRNPDALAAGLIEGLADAVSSKPSWGPAGWSRARNLFGLDAWSARMRSLFDELADASQPARRERKART